MRTKPARRSHRFGSRRGLSLIELMIVLVVFLIATGFGLEFARGLLVWQRLRSGADLFVSAVERARALAVARNGSYEVLVGETRKSFALAPADSEEPPLWLNLPRGVEFTRVPRRPIHFFSRGTAAPAGSYVLSSGKAEVTVVVAGSGRIRWEVSK